MIKDDIVRILIETTGTKDAELEFITNEAFGDYSSNIAMQGKGKNPREVAEGIVEKLKKDMRLSKMVDRIEVAGPGFINFWLKNDVLINNLIQIDEGYGFSDEKKEKLAIVEYSSPNIAKPFTIGHLRSTIIGDALANLLEATGWKVLRDNHLGDWGTQFGKMIYAIKTWGDEAKIAKSENPVKELVVLYVKFHEEAEKDESLEERAREWFKKLEDGDTEARRIWQECIDWSFVEFDRIYDILGVAFSKEFEKGRGLGESFFEDKMGVVVKELEDKKLLKEGKEGAKLVFFKGDKYPPAMILKKDGATLYQTRDLATDKYRLEEYHPDLIINEVGSEQTLYFQQLFEMERLLGWFTEGQRVHVGHGMIRFKEGKMSTRKGNVIWMEEVVSEALERAKDLGSEDRETAKKVAIGALKYNDLKRDPKTNIIFDWKEVLNMEGNSGPYLQYTIARTNSVIAKSKSENAPLPLTGKNFDTEELAILRNLVKFPEAVESAAKLYSPNVLCTYLYDLAQKYNSFYNKDKIIGSEKEEFRLALTSGVGQTLKNGLKLLGIEAPEKM